MTGDAEILAALTSIFREVFADDRLAIAPGTTPDDVPGWDSAKTVALIVAIEERFGIRMRTSELDRLDSVADFVAVVASRRASDATAHRR